MLCVREKYVRPTGMSLACPLSFWLEEDLCKKLYSIAKKKKSGGAIFLVDKNINI